MFKQVISIYMIKRLSSTNIYITHAEHVDLLDNLTAGELKLYSYLKFSPLCNRPPELFKADALACALNVNVQTIRNNLSSLRKKGYALIEFFKDERKALGVKVVVGKDQVELYNLGLDVQISDAQTYQKVLDRFPITDPTKTLDERRLLIEQANEYAKTLL